MNKALLEKWWWRFIEEKENLWHVVVKEKYGELNSEKETLKPKGPQGTSVWHGIYKTVNDFKRGCMMVVGDGRKTSFWHDRWVRETPLVTQFPHVFEVASFKETKVFELYTSNGSIIEWDLRIRNRLSTQQQAEKREIMTVLRRWK